MTSTVSTSGSPLKLAQIRSRAWLTAPVLLGGYGLIRLVPGSKHPGPGWTSGHTALLASLLVFGLLLHGLYRLAGANDRAALGPVLAARLGFGAALVGLAASLAQVAIDLYTGLRAADSADQSRMFAQIQSHPGVLPVVYQIGPLFFYLGLLALLTVLAVRRRVPVWSPLLVLVGTVAMAASLDLMTVGAVAYALALAPLRRAL